MIVDPLPHAWEFPAIGTSWRIDTAEPLPESVREVVTARIDRFDRDWSRFRDDSLVARIGREPGRHRLPAEAGPLLAWYRDLYESTAGRVSPLVGSRLAALGYDAAYRLRPADDLPPVPAWEDAIAWDGSHLEVLRAQTIDIGAAGKGLLVDLVGAELSDAGVAEWIVDASGDLRSTVPMRIALEHPADPTKAVGVAELTTGAFAASAVNRRAWGDGLHHVLDAVTGLPARDVVATWVLAADAMTADGAATALFFDADPAGLARWDVRFARMFADGRLEWSDGFPGERFA